jgi:hypothetical protein
VRLFRPPIVLVWAIGLLIPLLELATAAAVLLSIGYGVPHGRCG